MPATDITHRQDATSNRFSVVAVGALHAGAERGLAADILAAHAHAGIAYTVCTALVVANRTVVTDFVDVPPDTVDAQLGHLLETVPVAALKIGVLASDKTVERVFHHAKKLTGVPVLLDFTISGPAGETVLTERGTQSLLETLHVPDVVTIRRRDASLVTGIEINSLDDAQVAAQRLARSGARHVLIRCGRIPTQFFDADRKPPDWAVDLFYDGQEFSLFETPWIETNASGASSALTLGLLHGIHLGRPMSEAMQYAKVYAFEALRFRNVSENTELLNYFWQNASDSSAAASRQIENR